MKWHTDRPNPGPGEDSDNTDTDTVGGQNGGRAGMPSCAIIPATSGWALSVTILPSLAEAK